jgi:uncharacterized Zn-binding protein involved in type VI secretion
MPPAMRLGDKALIPSDAHGCPACPHVAATGPAIVGSPNVNTNARPAIRLDDIGIHAVCCGQNMWTAQSASATVNINGKGAYRIADQAKSCGGMGMVIEGSPNVIIGG